MREIESQGLASGVAQGESIQELENGDGKPKTTFAEGDGLLIAEKDARIDELKERVKELQKEVAFLRTRVEELTPLALPRPRFRWLGWLRHASV